MSKASHRETWRKEEKRSSICWFITSQYPQQPGWDKVEAKSLYLGLPPAGQRSKYWSHHQLPPRCTSREGAGSEVQSCQNMNQGLLYGM